MIAIGAAGTPIEVLLVEDHPGDVRLMEEAFRESNKSIHLHVDTDGVEAMAFLRREELFVDAPRPDIILLDLNLPKMDGREVLALMKDDESLKTIPIVILTTSESEADIVKSYQLQASCYISKPVRLAAFEDLVKRLNDFWLTKVKLPQKSIIRVLLIEDNPGDARLLREMLKVEGSLNTELAHVACMSEAETHLASGAVDIILLDPGLPDAQGLESIRRVRAIAPRVPLVVLTGFDDDRMAAQALQEGAQHYLIKGQIDARGLLLALLFAILSDTGLDPRFLILELTESVLVKRAESAASILHALRERGVKVAVDDFGTGYSSLSYLQKFPVDALKIDQSFVRQIGIAGDNKHIVTAVISMARSLKLRVVAEGVETLEELSFLRAHQCDEAQGYYFSRPVPAQQLVKLLETGIRVPFAIVGPVAA